jgi:hypothetical protein
VQKKEQQKAENAEGGAGGKRKKVTAAQLRVQKGIALILILNFSLYKMNLQEDHCLQMISSVANLPASNRPLRTIPGLDNVDRLPGQG